MMAWDSQMQHSEGINVANQKSIPYLGYCISNCIPIWSVKQNQKGYICSLLHRTSFFFVFSEHKHYLGHQESQYSNNRVICLEGSVLRLNHCGPLIVVVRSVPPRDRYDTVDYSGGRGDGGCHGSLGRVRSAIH